MQQTRHFSPQKLKNKSYSKQGWQKRSGSNSKFGSGNRAPRKRFGENIDISRFIKKASENVQEKAIEITHTFQDFNFCEPLKQNLDKREYKTPTPIQDQAISLMLEGRDMIGLANTGTGKTAAFLLPLIEKVYKDRSQKVLIIVPTRELALQIENEYHQFSWGMKIFSAVCVGGAPIYRQIQNLNRRPNFVIGTPGRLKDLSKRGNLKLNGFQNVVLDEADRMLDMGFIEDIKMMLTQLPKERQSLFFSATLPIKIKGLVSQFSSNPATIEVKTGETTKNVEQDIVRVDRSGKFDKLHEILSRSEVSKALIFVETKREVDKITTDLSRKGHKVDSIHGDKRQSQRQRALGLFKNDSINILVATDVAARGLDIKEVSHVINYTIPQTFDDYVHRIGRTGRGDCKGFAYTFVG
ncbi:hypothetical protein COY62_04400 [bacterium (Candidatus Howlettbacteria) CG_4_10_14_0_8_um_filter_40_9]|nr:MAG: hypothetical protein COY62_04400 [bacterium (Candidatus Howlettbacteria) CG_4_10_14_0_8_um_filter_40_9]